LNELRISSKNRNHNWITTEYNNQNAPASFYTIDLNENLNLWSTRNKITIPSTVVNGSVSELPVYVNLRHLPSNFWTSVKSSGSDIRVTNAAGTPLALELVSIDKVNKTGELWFKAPTLTSASHNHFYIYSGNNGGSFASPVSQYGSQAVWSNGYIAVWHMEQATSSNQLDSSYNNNPAVPQAPMSASRLIPGKLGNSLNFNGTTHWLQISDDYLSANELTNKVTSCAWARPNAFGQVFQPFLTSSIVSNVTFSTGFGIDESSTGRISTGFYNGAWRLAAKATNVSTANWYYICGTYNGTVLRVYQGSTLVASTAYTGILPNSGSGTWRIARRHDLANYFSGQLDHITLSNKERNRNWITTEYNNQSFPERFYMINNLSLMNATFFGRMF
jgi:hypothetical protein